MRWILFLLVLSIGFGCATNDPISRQTAKLSHDGLWENGIYPIITLSQNATTEQILKEWFRHTDSGSIKNFKIIKQRKVEIAGSLPDIYTAVLIDTNLGKRVVIYKWVGSQWWAKVFSAE